MATVNVNSITINSTSGNYGYGPFYRNNNITSVDLQYATWTNNSMVNAFAWCNKLTSVTNINSNVTNMSCAFGYCERLTDAPVIPNSVTNMAETFLYCPTLINVPSISNSVINMYYTFSECENLVNVPSIPNSVTDMYATFERCSRLVTAPIIPNSVTSMYYTFYYCTNLSGSIYIYSENVRSAWACFEGTNALLQKNVYIPFKYANNVNTLTYNSFINAGYDTNGSYGVWLRDIATL